MEKKPIETALDEETEVKAFTNRKLTNIMYLILEV